MGAQNIRAREKETALISAAAAAVQLTNFLLGLILWLVQALVRNTVDAKLMVSCERIPGIMAKNMKMLLYHLCSFNTTLNAWIGFQHTLSLQEANELFSADCMY